MSQPKTRPTCPPDERPKIIVEETEAMTPMMEKENAMVSRSCGEREKRSSMAIDKGTSRTNNARRTPS